ncbi:MAG: ABC transporter permease [Cyclobacteriaceae bacterium]|nr:ABC transporter permease [Cyclobacteriaceae bacterium]
MENEKKDKTNPPRWATRLLSWYCKPELLEDLQGDLCEYFERNVRAHGVIQAKLIYAMDVLKFIRPYTVRLPVAFYANQWGLLTSYFVSAQRSLGKHKLNTFLNILGLTIGVVCFTLISAHLQKELSYDRHYLDAERIYRISMSWRSLDDGQTVDLAWVDEPLTARLRDNYPEVEAIGSFVKKRGILKVRCQQGIFSEDNFFDADSTYFSVFQHAWIEGNPKTALTEVASVVLTEKLAIKYFGDAHAVNKTILIGDTPHNVTGVIRDLPPATHLKFDALVSNQSHFDDWCFTYVKLNDPGKFLAFQQKLDTLFADEMRPILNQSAFDGSYHLEALTDIHLSSQKLFDATTGNPAALYTFFALAFLVLLISIINYINLSVAQIMKRQGEIGIRKIMGALQGQIRAQYMMEAVVMGLLSLLVAGLFLTYASFAWHDVDIYAIDGANILPLVGFVTCVVIAICALAGWYPAFQLSKVSAMQNLKGTARIRDRRGIRNFLLVFQLTACLALVFVTHIVKNQMTVLNGSTAHAREQVMVVDIPDDETLVSQLPGLKNSIEQLSFVKGASLIGFQSTPTRETNFDIFGIEQSAKQSIYMLGYVEVDSNYFDVLGIPFLQGRNFNASDVPGFAGSVIINQAMQKHLGWSDPLSEKIIYGGLKGEGLPIVGVVSDYHVHGNYRKAEPLLFYLHDGLSDKLLIKLSQANDEMIRQVNNVWKDQLTGLPFEFQFLDDYFNRQLADEKRLQGLLTNFSWATVFIASLGLFGLINLQISQRMKETSIRKIFGARVYQLLILVWREFGALALVASMLAFPFGYLSISGWLEGFVNRTSVSVFDVMLSLGSLVGVMSLALVYHVSQLLRINPIENIKSE